MSEFNFKSAICTTREQSERLLALGLKPETADMVHRSYGYIIDEFGNKERRFKQPTLVVDGWESKYDIPAWSLHRLIEMINEEIQTDWESMCLQDRVFTKRDNLYDNIIDCIEWLIKEGYFNKEYLEE